VGGLAEYQNRRIVVKTIKITSSARSQTTLFGWFSMGFGSLWFDLQHFAFGFSIWGWGVRGIIDAGLWVGNITQPFIDFWVFCAFGFMGPSSLDTLYRSGLDDFHGTVWSI
jgi:hypothetical protein